MEEAKRLSGEKRRPRVVIRRFYNADQSTKLMPQSNNIAKATKTVTPSSSLLETIHTAQAPIVDAQPQAEEQKVFEGL